MYAATVETIIRLIMSFRHGRIHVTKHKIKVKIQKGINRINKNKNTKELQVFQVFQVLKSIAPLVFNKKYCTVKRQ